MTIRPRDDGDVVPSVTRAESLRSTSIALFTNGPRSRGHRDARRRPDPRGEVPDVVARQFVRLELHGSGDPSALWRRGAHDDFLIRRRGAAREGAAIERNAIRRRIAREKPRCDCAARRPPRRPRLGKDHGPIGRRRIGDDR